MKQEPHNELTANQLDDLRAERKSATKIKEALEQLEGCAGWAVFKEFIERQIRVREISALYNTDIEVKELGASRERLAGEATGLQLALKFTEMLLPDAKETILKIDELENN